MKRIKLYAWYFWLKLHSQFAGCYLMTIRGNGKLLECACTCKTSADEFLLRYEAHIEKVKRGSHEI